MADRTTRPLERDVLAAVLAGIAAVAGAFAVAGWSRDAFVVAPVDAVVVENTPAPLVTFAIENLGSAGHALHVGLSVAIVVAGLGAATLIATRAGHAVGGLPLTLALTALLVFGGLFVPTGATGPALVGAASAVAVVGIAAVAVDGRPSVDVDVDGSTAAGGTDRGRRRLLELAVATLGYAGLATLVGTRTGTEPEPVRRGLPDDGRIADLLALAETRTLPIAGLTGLLSTNEEFYEVDISTFDPDLDPGDWSLSITGQVAEEVRIDYDDLTAMDPEHRFVTLRCVGESLNGHKMDTALWTGVPIRSLVDRADPSGRCGCVKVYAADGYYQVFPVEALERGFLAYGMNGETLPRGHGRPARLLVPGHWGEINVKWVTEFELLDEEQLGYWEERGWHGTGPVNTVAKLHAVNHGDDGTVEVAGHAYAGTRGIQRVEVSTDGGDTWADAELSEPLPGEDVWRQWRYEFAGDGTHEVVVRATDGTGTLQPEADSNPFPSGATGWVSRTVRA
ncbi:molybdopterin-dependent oxidoreductase [Haloarchaeobius sp. HRN-SO-5]|uniref:molybdopterin-dependent oxidoreductase n=1 Tax=Haloarchaeobius sp. HRN-SO-5 TaxID=3446118 RepID=UPI003EC07F3C